MPLIPESAMVLLHLDGAVTDELSAATVSVSGTQAFSSAQSKFGGQSLQLNGSSYLRLVMPNTDAMTVSCWFYITASNTSGAYPTLFSTDAYSASGGTYMHVDDGSYSTYPVCRSNSSSASGNNGQYGTTVVSRNAWHHFAYCRSGSSHYYFIDGVLQATVTQASPNEMDNIYFGCMFGTSAPVSGCYFTGYIDEIMVADTCLWTSGFTPPTDAYTIAVDNSGLYVKLNGAWAKVLSGYEKINGVWSEIADPAALFSAYANGSIVPYEYGGEIEPPVPQNSYAVESVSGASYGFALNADDYYESQNGGVNSSASLCKVVFTLGAAATVTFHYINYAEARYDYAIFSEVDTDLGTTYTADSSGYALICSTAAYNVSTEQTLSYDMPAGTHYVVVKYRKDSSQSSYNDSLQFRVTIE